jgi:glycosyltransferase involved in cell wall biosynthesis
MQQQGKQNRQIYWVDLNRFDTKTDKSTWIEMARALGEHGYRVCLLTGGSPGAPCPSYPWMEVIRIASIDVPLLFRSVLLARVLARLARLAGPRDIVILDPNGLWIAPLLRLLRKGRVHLDIRTLPVALPGLKRRVDRLLFWSLPLRLLGRVPEGHSFITERLRAAVDAEHRIDYPHYVVWASGVNTAAFRVRTALQAPGEAGRFELFYHGKVMQQRGLDSVLRALALLEPPDRAQLRFTVVGDGPGLSEMRELARRLGIEEQVRFKGLIPYERVPDELAHADCCICPLPDRAEWNVSSPLKVFEYFACGKPVVLTPIPAHTDLFTGAPGVVWAAGDAPQDFAEAIARALRERERLAAAAVAHAETALRRFDWKIQGQVLADYFAATFREPEPAAVGAGRRR